MCIFVYFRSHRTSGIYRGLRFLAAVRAAASVIPAPEEDLRRVKAPLAIIARM